jgi:hypothetical protein
MYLGFSSNSQLGVACHRDFFQITYLSCDFQITLWLAFSPVYSFSATVLKMVEMDCKN